MDEILAFVRREDPDVLALQEVYDGHDPCWERKFRSMDVLRQELRYPFEHFAPGFLERTDFGKVEQGNAVLSKFPIVEREVIAGDVPYGEREDKPEYYEYTPRNVQRVAIDVGGRLIQVFNTQGVWGVEGQDNERRLAMGQVMAHEVAKYKNVILAGDFNVQESTKTIGLIEEHLVNLFKGERVSSFNMRHKTNPGFATAVVDMIFVSSHIEVLEKRSCDDDVSDHLALTATLQIS